MDWIALSFVQRPEDVTELRAIVGDRTGVMAKLEKPSAIEQLDAIVSLSDAMMVARGDLGVEMPPEQVPPIQWHIVRACRQSGKPCVVGTQMLESMIQPPTATPAKASDVASAIYHGADAVMLSAESAPGQYPQEAVTLMDRIITVAENDRAHYRPTTDAARPEPTATIPDAICASMRQVTGLLPVAAVVTYTTSGSSSLRAARERPATSILSMATSHGNSPTADAGLRRPLRPGACSQQPGRNEHLCLQNRSPGGLCGRRRHHRCRRRHPYWGVGNDKYAEDCPRIEG